MAVLTNFLLQVFSLSALYADSSECRIWCAPTATKEHFASVIQQLRVWEQQEVRHYTSHGLAPLRLEDTILKPYVANLNAPNNTVYGQPNLRFILRKAAKFTELLLGRKEVVVLRLNTRHPISGGDFADAHTEGLAADLGYMTISDESGKRQFDLEGQFWLTYMLMKLAAERGGAAWSGMAYKSELLAYGKKMISLGLIENLNVLYPLTYDLERYHVAHFHFALLRGAL